MRLVEVSSGEWRGLFIEEFADSELVGLFGEDEFPASSFLGKVEVVASNIAPTYRLALADGREFFAKSFSRPPIISMIKSRFAPVGAARSWKAATVAGETGIPTPRPVALMERRTLGMAIRGVFISEAMPNALGQNLEHYFRENFDTPRLTRELILEKREIIKKIAAMFRAAHAQDRIYFPDFHPHNMVIQKPPEGGTSLYLVDFDEVRFKVRRDDRMKNLSSLGRNADKIVARMKHKSITTGDRLRFLRAYLGDPARDEVEELAAEIVRNWNLK